MRSSPAAVLMTGAFTSDLPERLISWAIHQRAFQLPVRLHQGADPGGDCHDRGRHRRVGDALRSDGRVGRAGCGGPAAGHGYGAGRTRRADHHPVPFHRNGNGGHRNLHDHRPAEDEAVLQDRHQRHHHRRLYRHDDLWPGIRLLWS